MPRLEGRYGIVTCPTAEYNERVTLSSGDLRKPFDLNGFAIAEDLHKC